MIEEKDIIEAGKFQKPHGLKGELNTFVDFNSKILEKDYPLIVEMDGIYVPFYAESVRPKGHFSSLVKLEGVDSVDNTRKFVNKVFYLLRRDVAEFFDIEEDDIEMEDDFIGYKVFDQNGKYLGKVEELDISTENMLLLVRPDSTPDDDEPDILYIPFNDDLIMMQVDSEDPSESEIHLDLPEGLLELNA